MRQNGSGLGYTFRVLIILAFVAFTAAIVVNATQKTSSSGTGLMLRLADAHEGPAAHTFSPAVTAAFPSVVNISSSKVVRTSAAVQRMEHDPVFRQFLKDSFGGPLHIPKERREQSLGSGVIVSPNGYILTNSHVVNAAEDVRVTLGDKREFKAEVIGADPHTDVAVLRIDATGLPALVIGDSSKVKLGDCVLAIGNPFGVGQAVTMGIVSATGRRGLGIEDYEDFIQTDAAINPGNSGGALVNDRGELIGINTAIISPAGANQGVGFAIPVNFVRGIAEELTRNGAVVRPYIGLMPQDITPRLAQALGLRDTDAVLVADVAPDGPAARAGVQKGDIILTMNGQRIDDASELRLDVARMRPDAVLRLQIQRDGTVQDIPVKLAALPSSSIDAPLVTRSSATLTALEGIRIEALTPQIRRALRTRPGTSGVVVTEIDPASRASESEIEPGDIIEQVNRTPVTTVKEYNAAVAAAGGNPVLRIRRDDATFYLAP
jgi:serine protease Do